jgi:hypothetical protein
MKGNVSKERIAVYKSILFWFSSMSVGTGNNSTEIENVLASINKYFNKRKPDIFEKTTETYITNKLNDIRDLFEDIVTIEEDKEKLKDRSVDVRTISYSPTLLAIQFLDELINQIGDHELRVRFGHINTGDMLISIEEKHNEITINSYKIFNKLTKSIKGI